jgi:hypothetical protein
MNKLLSTLIAFCLLAVLLIGGLPLAYAADDQQPEQAMLLDQPMADLNTTIHVLGAVNHQGPVTLSTAEMDTSLAAILTTAISKAGGFKEFAKTDKLKVYFTEGVDDRGVQYNNECTFRYNTDDHQSDKDCRLLMAHPERIYRVWIEGSTRKSRWGYLRDGLQLFGNIAVPVILASD